MATRKDARFDFRGGVNLSHSADVLDLSEISNGRNVDLIVYGALRKRPGTKRIHDAAIGAGAAVLGLRQWLPGIGRQVVAIANGNLYHKLAAATDFTAVTAALSTTVRPSFTEHIIAGVPSLFIADGTLRKWDGAALAAVAGAPDATRIAVYKTRMFAIDGSKTVYWSRVSNPEDWSFEFGGSAPVETYDAEPLVALQVVGSSLLLIKRNSIARFTGVASENIRIDQETEGISADIGTVAPNTVIRVEEFVFLLTDRGPYMATEAGVQAVGPKVEKAFGENEAALDNIANAVAVHHKGRKEVWVFIPEAGETQNTAGWCWNYRVNAWTGPWEFGGTFDPCSAAMYEREDGTESALLGGYDGFVREGAVQAVGGLDDVLRAGTGGSAVTFSATLPVLLFRAPSEGKRLNQTQWLSADLGADGSLTISCAGDDLAAESVSVASLGAGNKMYDFRPGTEGRRIVMTLEEATDNLIQINGLELMAEMTGRSV